MADLLNSLGLPAHWDEKAQLEEELGGITSRINKALTQFDDENKDGEREWDMDERSAFQSRYETMTARMETMANERNGLLSSLAEWLETTEREPWDPDETHSGMSSPEDPGQFSETDRDMKFSTVVSTRMGVQKLRKLNEDMVQQAVKGKDIEDLAKKENVLQKKVVNKFKNMMEARKRGVIVKTLGAHWKHASEEIVSLINRIRSEGTSGIEDFEAQLVKAAKAIQRQADEIQSYEQTLQDKEKEIIKLRKDIDTITNDNALLKSEKERYRDQIMKYRKTLKQQRHSKTPIEQTSEFSDHEEEELQRLITPKTPVVSSFPAKQQYSKSKRRTPSTTKKTTPFTPVARVNVVLLQEERPPSSDVVDTLEFDKMWQIEEEYFDMKNNILLLEKKIIEKEHKMLSLEHQIHELIEIIKNTTPQILPKLNDDLKVQGPSVSDIAYAVKTAADEVIQESKTTAKISTKKEEQDRSYTKQQSYSNLADAQSLLSNANAPSPRDSPISPSSALAPSPILDSQQIKPEIDPEVVQQWQQENESLQQELNNAKSELRRAQWELISLRHDQSQRVGVAMFTSTIQSKVAAAAAALETDVAASGKEKVTPSMTKMLLELNGSQESSEPSDVNRTAKALENIRTQDYLPADTKPDIEYDDEFKAYADLIRAERGKFKHRLYVRPKMVGVVRTDGQISMDSSSNQDTTNLQEYAVEDQGMQTDPTLDPLGAWSNVPTIQMKDKLKGSKKSFTNVNLEHPTSGPLPPKEWAMFDPTALQETAARSTHRVSLGNIFDNKGVPKHVESTSDLISFVEGELQRLTQGITGYTGYLNNLIENEVSSMVKTNENMRRKLSVVTLKQMDKMRELAATKSEEKHVDIDVDKETTPVRRGRFEIIKPGKKSQHITKKAFGSYFAGRRFLTQQGDVPVLPHTKKRLISTGGQPYPWETYARDHIYRSEMKAAEHSEPRARYNLYGSCDILKRQVDEIAQHAICILRGTTTFFKETLTNQIDNRQRDPVYQRTQSEPFREIIINAGDKTTDPTEVAFGNTFDNLDEFDLLHGAVQLKEDMHKFNGVSEEPVVCNDPPAKDDSCSDFNKPIGPRISKSRSHSSFLEKRKEGQDDRDELPALSGPAVNPTNALHMPSQTVSLSSIQSSHRYLPPLLLYQECQPRNRKQYQLPKATLPKRGTVTLAVSAGLPKSTQNDENKPYDSKRRHRPAPQTHNKLLSKQKELLLKTIADTNEMSGTTVLDLRHHVLELPIGWYVGSGSTSLKEGVYTGHVVRATERKNLILNAQEQLREGAANKNKYTAIFSQT